MALAQEQVSVTLLSRRRAALERAATHIEDATGHRPRVIDCDIATPQGQDKALASGPYDILVTNAGGPPSKDFRALSPEDWLAALNANLLSAVALIRGSVDAMIGNGFGRIVNITSLSVRMPVERLDLSTTARLGLTGYVAGVARQVARHNVTVNNLLPGTIMTERIKELGETADRLIAKVPAGRGGQPEEFGAVCAFLCGTPAAYITGQNLLVDGGLCPITV